jgi:hypothetical protein
MMKTLTVGETGAIMRAFEQAFVDAQLIEPIDAPTRQRAGARRAALTAAFAAKVEIPPPRIGDDGVTALVKQVDYVDTKLKGFVLWVSSTGAKVWMLPGSDPARSSAWSSPGWTRRRIRGSSTASAPTTATATLYSWHRRRVRSSAGG